MRPINSALEYFAMVSPITTLSGALGAGVLAVGLGPHTEGGHYDLLIAAGVGILILTAVEIALARRFNQHEKQEVQSQEAMLKAQRDDFIAAMDRLSKELHAEMNRVLTVFDGQGAVYTATLRDCRATAQAAQEARNDITEVSKRIQKLEERFGKRDP